MTHSDPESTRLEVLLRSVAAGSRRVAWAESFGRLALAFGLTAVLIVLLARSVAGWDPLAALAQPPLVGAIVVSVVLFVVAAAIAGWRSRAHQFDAASSALWLDLRAGSGGEVVTASELGQATNEAASRAWRARAEELAATVDELPRADWRGAATRAGAGTVVVLLSVLLPVRETLTGGPNALPEVFEERIEALEEKLATLDEEVGLDEEERAEVAAALERLEASLDDEPDLEATYEALDTLEEQLGVRAEEALAAASGALAQIEEESRMADASGEDSAGLPLDSGSPVGDPDSNALEDLVAGLDLPGAGLDLEGVSLEGADLGELAELAAADLSQLSAEELKALKEALQAAMSGPLESLASAGLLKDAGSFNGDFKSLSELGALSEAELAMLEAGEPCPDCGKTPAENPGGT